MFTSFKEIFHSATHWLQACGIFKRILEPYMNKLKVEPLPKKSKLEGLTPEQLTMLWLIWSIGITVAVLAFLVELMAGVKKKHKARRTLKAGHDGKSGKKGDPLQKSLTLIEVK